MFNNKHFFKNLHQNDQKNVATGCDRSTLVSKGQGLAKSYDRLGNLWLLPNSLYIPELTINLLALSAIVKNETLIKRTSSQLEIYLDNKSEPFFICPTSSSVLETQIKLTNSHCLNSKTKEDGDIWHKQLGHMNKNDMKKLINTTENKNKIFNAFPALIQTSEDESFNHQSKDNSHNDESISSDNDDEDSFVDASEQQPQRIRAICPRHATRISSEINSKNILPFHRRKPRIIIT
ncbi:hypothetical protein O181_082082 [Austropuccinia psidii MF-1]|uniref:GAG-pre-integrase domain-containing protein n=1 Tax=Austropuccinia psidii MF-1 TaxID=1389203 RepID=A0A9Q3IIW8_9BASI|nr:hypothetical protein [Austropuccinia psidii MF-1]